MHMIYLFCMQIGLIVIRFLGTPRSLCRVFSFDLNAAC